MHLSKRTFNEYDESYTQAELQVKNGKKKSTSFGPKTVKSLSPYNKKFLKFPEVQLMIAAPATIAKTVVTVLTET